MKTKLILILMIAMALVFVSCQNESQPLQSMGDMQNLEGQSLSKTWEQAAEDLNEKFTKAMADLDIDAFMECIWNSPDAILVLERGDIVRGWDNIYGGVAGMMATYGKLDLEINRISRFRYGDFVFSVGQATWKRWLPSSDFNGPPDESFQEVWTDVTRKVKGKWVVVVNHPHWVGEVGDPWPPWIAAQ